MLLSLQCPHSVLPVPSLGPCSALTRSFQRRGSRHPLQSLCAAPRGTTTAQTAQCYSCCSVLQLLFSATVIAQCYSYCYSYCSVLQLLLSAAAYCSVLQIIAQSYKLLLLLQFSGRALVWKRLETVKRVFSYDL